MRTWIVADKSHHAWTRQARRQEPASPCRPRKGGKVMPTATGHVGRRKRDRRVGSEPETFGLRASRP